MKIGGQASPSALLLLIKQPFVSCRHVKEQATFALNFDFKHDILGKGVFSVLYHESYQSGIYCFRAMNDVVALTLHCV